MKFLLVNPWRYKISIQSENGGKNYKATVTDLIEPNGITYHYSANNPDPQSAIWCAIKEAIIRNNNPLNPGLY